MANVPNSVDWRRRAAGQPPRPATQAPRPATQSVGTTSQVSVLGPALDADGRKRTLAERLGISVDPKPAQVEATPTVEETSAAVNDQQPAHQFPAEPSATGSESQPLNAPDSVEPAVSDQLQHQEAGPTDVPDDSDDVL